MKKENFNLEKLHLQEGKRTFTNENAVKEFYKYLELTTKERFEAFRKARIKSNELAFKTYIL